MDDDADPPALAPSGVQHGHPPEGLECLATFEDITSEDGNYVEYQTAPHYVKNVPRLRSVAGPCHVLLMCLRARTPCGHYRRPTGACQTRVFRAYRVPCHHPSKNLAHAVTQAEA